MEATVHQTKPTYWFGPFRLLMAEQQLLRDGAPVPLTPKIFDILRVFVQNAGHLVDKEALLSEVWPDTFVEEANLNRAVSVLRKALGDDTADPRYIETIPKRGYRFIMPVSVLPGGADSLDTAFTGTAEEVFEPAATAVPTVWLSLARVLALAGSVAMATLTVNSHAPRARTDPAVAPIHRQLTFRGREAAPAISPDGRRIAYVSDDGTERRVVVQDLDGGLPTVLLRAPEIGRLRWSPDGSQVMLFVRGTANDGVFVVPSLGGSPAKIAKGPFLGTWSPDGNTIVFPRFLAGKLTFVNRQSGKTREITLQPGPQWVQDLDWSAANGQLVVVTRSDGGRFAIRTTEPDGTAQRIVVDGEREISAARWAPDGRAVYFLQFENQTHSLYRVSWRRTDQGPSVPALLMSGLETDGALAISADGTRLVYSRAPYSSNLWMIDVVAGQPPVVSELTRGTSVIERPRISPDGKSVVFNMGRELVANLYRMHLGGGEPEQLTFFDAFSVEGVWSADGQRIAFASTQAGRRGVWVVDANGGTPRALAVEDLSDSFDLSWSPGAEVLYQVIGNRTYVAVHPDTGALRRLASNDSMGWMFSPVMSPDRQQIAVAWNRPPNSGLWVIDRRTSKERLVHGTRGGPLAWSADGASVYVLQAGLARYRGLPGELGETSRDAKILRVSIDGETAETLFSLPFEEVGGVTITPDGRRLVCAVYSSRSDVWMVENFDSSKRH